MLWNVQSQWHSPLQFGVPEQSLSVVVSCVVVADVGMGVVGEVIVTVVVDLLQSVVFPWHSGGPSPANPLHISAIRGLMEGLM